MTGQVKVSGGGEDQKQERLALLKAILDKIHLSVLILDERNIIIGYNQQAENCDGLSRSEVLGQNPEKVFAHFYYGPAVDKVRRSGKALLDQRFTGLNCAGNHLDVLFDVYPFFFQKRLAAVYIIGRALGQIADFVASTLERQRRLAAAGANSHQQPGCFLDDLVGRSEALKRCVKTARKMARRDASILIVGETGTGKDLFAQGLHNAGFQADGPFVPINCAALPQSLQESILFGTVRGSFTGASNLPGLFEQAEGGTLFLDEINSMPLVLQAKLLRVLQEKQVRRIGGQDEIPVNCRIISATNVNPWADMQKRAVRPDLFFRLATMILPLPALRDRASDIPLLIRHFIKKYNQEFGLSVEDIDPEIVDKMTRYSWPGNVRELGNLVENAMNMIPPGEKTIRWLHLPEHSRSRLSNLFPLETARSEKAALGLKEQMANYEQGLIEEALSRCGGNISRAARSLGLLRQNLHHKIRKYGLSAKP